MARFKVVKGKLIEIVEGYTNLTKKVISKPNSSIEEMSSKRYKICDMCEFNNGRICTKCKCPLAAKTRSTKSKCPLNKW